MAPFDLDGYLAARRRRIDAELARIASGWDGRPARLKEAMRYSLLAPGKRIRPILALASCVAVGGPPEAAIPAACAIEMIHAFSLVHDDLPAMDDDDLRRGSPTCHKKFDEATAILAGDTLLAEAFVLLTAPGETNPLSPLVRIQVLSTIARATGILGMAGGQQMDIDSEGKGPPPADIEELDRRKTAALIRAAVVAGGLAGGADEATVGCLARYGENIGLAFQITDDTLDVEGDAATVGKAVKKDLARGKATLPSAIGLEAARARASALTSEGIDAIVTLGPAAEPLRAIAALVLRRSS